MEKSIEYLGRNFLIHYSFAPTFEPIGMARRVLAENEYTSIKSQAPELLSILHESFKKIPSEHLTFRKVVDTAQESEVFKTFKGISQYTCEVWDECFLCEMAHDVLKQMTPNDIRENLDLFCSLSCITFADKDSKVAKIDKSQIDNGILEFTYFEPKASRKTKVYRLVRVTNFFDSENRKITTSFVKLIKIENLQLVHY